MSKVLIIDLDTPCFSSAAAVDHRGILVTHKTGIQKSFKNRTEFKDLMKSKQKLHLLEEYSIEDTQDPEPIENALHILYSKINSYVERFEPDKVVCSISGSNNFRSQLPLPTQYKSNRTDIRPKLLPEVIQAATKKFKPIVSVGCEPDDVIIYTGYEYLANGDEVVVVASDKDSLAYSGLTLWNPDKPEEDCFVVPELGSLWKDSKNKVRGNGFMFYCHQMSIGDGTDCYRPTELAGVKFGEASSFKLLKDCKTKQEAFSVVVKQYKDWYPEEFEYSAWNGDIIKADWKFILQLYHMCVRMKETEFDTLNIDAFCKRQGVEL